MESILRIPIEIYEMSWLQSTIWTKIRAFCERDFLFLQLLGLTHEHAKNACSVRLAFLVVYCPLNSLWLLHIQLDGPFFRLRITSLQVLGTMIDQVIVLT